MEDHTSGTDFATDLLSGKWKFIGNGVGSNVSQTQLIGELPFTQTMQTATLSDLPTNYDYILVTYLTNWGNRSVQVLSTDGDFYEIWQSFEVDYSNGGTKLTHILKFHADKTIEYSATNITSTEGTNKLYIHSIVGIKIQELTTDYLASLAMPSTVYETLVESASNTYVMSNDGYFSVEATPSSTDITGQIQILSDRHIWAGSYVPSKNSYLTTGVTLCTKAGDTVSVRKSSKATNYTYKLIYTVGAAKELGLID